MCVLLLIRLAGVDDAADPLPKEREREDAVVSSVLERAENTAHPIVPANNCNPSWFGLCVAGRS